MKDLISERRFSLFNEVLENRTRYLTVVLEDIFQPHNASAVLRSCDCFGVQDVHIVENKNEYRINPQVVMGSSKWLTINRYNSEVNNTVSTIKRLKHMGYHIVATNINSEATPVDNYKVSNKKTAILFGTEYTGLSDIAISLADENILIPQYGFTESLNISVSAAIIMKTLMKKLRESKANWHITEVEKNDLLFEWICKSVNKPELIIEEFLR